MNIPAKCANAVLLLRMRCCLLTACTELFNKELLPQWTMGNSAKLWDAAGYRTLLIDQKKPSVSFEHLTAACQAPKCTFGSTPAFKCSTTLHIKYLFTMCGADAQVTQ